MTELPAAELLVEDRGAVRLIRLQRPQAKNALTLELIAGLQTALSSANRSPEVRG